MLRKTEKKERRREKEKKRGSAEGGLAGGRGRKAEWRGSKSDSRKHSRYVHCEPYFLFWVSFYWMSLLLYVFVYTLVLLVLSLFYGSGLRN